MLQQTLQAHAHSRSHRASHPPGNLPKHLSTDQREALLDAVWKNLRIRPGMVTADGNVGLALPQCGVNVRAKDAALMRMDGQEHRNVMSQLLVSLLRRWTR